MKKEEGALDSFFLEKVLMEKKTTDWVEWEWQKSLDDMRTPSGALMIFKRSISKLSFLKKNSRKLM